MAIPLIGSLGDLNQSANMALTSQRYLGESLTKMGEQIGETISQRQMFSDADKAAPFMQRAFLESFDTIAGGDINGGLGKAIGAAAQFSTNPILARIAQDGVRTAGLMTNAVMEQYQQQNQNWRVQAGFDAYNQRTGAKYDAATQKEISGIEEEFSAIQQRASDQSTPVETREMDTQRMKALKARHNQLTTSAQTQQPSSQQQVAEMPRPPFGPNSTPEATNPESGVQMPEGDPVNQHPSGTPAATQPAQPDAQPQVASQTTGEQFEAVQPLTESATSSYGSVPILARFEQSGWIPSVRTDSKDGTTITYKKEGELPQKVVIPKKVSDAFDDYNKADAAITEPTREYLASIGGTSNAKSIDLHVAESDNNEKPTAYYMTTTVIVPGKEKGTFIKKTVPYQKYDEFGIPTHVKIPASEGDKIQVMKDSQAVFTKGVEFQKDAGFAKQETESQKKAADVAAMLKQKEAEIPMPFGMNEADAAKKIGLDPEKLKGEGIAQFKISAAKVIEDIIDDPKFVAARTAKNVNAMTTEFVNAYKNDMERNGSLASKFKPSKKEKAADEPVKLTEFQQKEHDDIALMENESKAKSTAASNAVKVRELSRQLQGVEEQIAVYDEEKNWTGESGKKKVRIGFADYVSGDVANMQKGKLVKRQAALTAELAKITGN